jgi:hypothetical protein
LDGLLLRGSTGTTLLKPASFDVNDFIPPLLEEK